ENEGKSKEEIETIKNNDAVLNSIRNKEAYQTVKTKEKTLKAGDKISKEDAELLNEMNILKHKKGYLIYKKDSFGQYEY
ncbi:hypothetical protein ABK046_52340, partial [Streptomyces caeruleatus]